ncbi:hypothetical protein ACVNP1_07410 [Staphylococcus aureus]
MVRRTVEIIKWGLSPIYCNCHNDLCLIFTEATSNTATATMILPILATLSVAVGVHPLLLMAPAAMAANCAATRYQ